MSEGVRRRATAADLAPITALDARCFGNPWSEEIYRQELERSLSRLTVLEADGRIVGLSCTWVVGDEAHLLRIATVPELRRRGLGRELLRAAIDDAIAAGCAIMLLEVAAANEPARALYEAFGFEELARRKGYYKRPPDDAVVMQRRLRARDMPA
ncbi:MAG: ribosomal protein S18-alanine N-acetyltransferase [Myxococcales bacterium]|nr:ribosomal protein S18-alanine N-acetyltransferase [Myxococcales bacterium]